MDPDSADLALLKLGSAPKGTFEIPNEGLRPPVHGSFLARFQSRNSGTAFQHRQSSVDLSTKSSHVFQTPAQSQTATPETTSSSAQPQSSEPNHVTRSASLKASFLKAAAFLTAETAPPDDPTSEDAPDQASDDQSDLQIESSSPEPDTDPEIVTQNVAPSVEVAATKHEVSTPNGRQHATSEDQVSDRVLVSSKTPEQVADEEEDTLINVLPDKDSLLFEGRPSYSILRFCSANALLNQKTVDKLGLPVGFIWTPFGDMSNIVRISHPPRRCATCKSFLAKGNGADDVLNGSYVWKCAFCNHGQNLVRDDDSQSMPHDANQFSELSVDTFEYLQERRDPPPTASKRGAIVLIVDENIDHIDADWARVATHAVHAMAAEQGLRFMLMTVGSICSVMRRPALTRAETPVLEVMSVAHASSLPISEKEGFFLGDPPPLASPNGHAIGNGHAGFPSQERSGSFTDTAIRALTEPYGKDVGNDTASTPPRDEVDTQSPRKSVRLPSEMEHRRLDLAIGVAFELLNGTADMESSRIFSMITGSPTMSATAHQTGDGEVLTSSPSNEAKTTALAKVYEKVGAKAGERRLALDFLVFGVTQTFNAQLLLAVVKRSRGGMVHSAAHSFSSASALAEAACFLARRSTQMGVVSIRVSTPLVVSRVIGPAFPTAAAHTYTVPGIDGSIGFTVVLKTRNGVDEESSFGKCAVVQLATKVGLTTRVVTVRIPVAQSAIEFTNGMDAEISALVLGKACVVSGGGLVKPDVVAKSVDATVRQLIDKSEKTASVIRLLYELRRGSLVEEQLDRDHSLLLRSMFLRAEASLASLLMSPRLFTNTTTDETTGLMAEVPLEETQMTANAVLVLDTGLNIFVYVGDEASAEAEEGISGSASNVALHRSAPCQLWKLNPGVGADFVLNTYLSASDKNRSVRRAKKGIHRGFIGYCESISPGSKLVRALREHS